MTQHPLSGLSIAILEDDYYQAQDCRIILEDAGARIAMASAMIPHIADLLAKGPVDLVLIDINLGYGLSFDFARSLKAQGTPFVFLTGYDSAMLPEDLTGSPYLSKPADAARIVATIMQLTGRAPRA